MYDGITADWADLLAGSVAVLSSASVTLGDDVILDDLPITGGQVTKSSDGRQIQQTLTLTTSDDVSQLLSGPGSPLMPLGQQIAVRAGLADKPSNPVYAELLPLGVFGIDSPAPENEVPWKLYPNGAWLVTGTTVTVSGSDPLAQLAREEFVTPERPALSATVRSETERLLQDRMSVADWGPGFDGSMAVSRQVVYEDSRLGTVLDLAQMVGGVAWSDRDGSYDLLSPLRQAAGVWRLAVGNPDDPGDTGALITWRPNLTRDGLCNAVMITSEDGNGNELRGVTYETTGPLAWGGPFGRVLLREENRLLKSNRACQAYADTRYAQMIDARAVVVHVTCLPNMALDPLDTIEILLPGGVIFGLITSITYPLVQGVMEMDVSIPLADWMTGLVEVADQSATDAGFGSGPFGRAMFGGDL